MKNLVIINAPFNLGLKQLGSDRPPGVQKLPAWLQQHGLHEALHPKHISTIEAPAYSMKLDPVSGVLNADEIVDYTRKLSAAIQPVIGKNDFVLVVGGDCSILLGCAHALKTSGRYALFFLDGHTDYVTTNFSATKAVAGMDLAIVTGNGHEKLTAVDGLGPYCKEEDVYAVGNRCYDASYVQLIKNSGIDYYDLGTIRKVGPEAIVKKFIHSIQQNECEGCWIHLDVDVLDNGLMPCVDSPQPGGLTYDELKTILTLLISSGFVRGMDITILDPDLDPDGQYTRQFVGMLSDVFHH